MRPHCRGAPHPGQAGVPTLPARLLPYNHTEGQVLSVALTSVFASRPRRRAHRRPVPGTRGRVALAGRL